MKIGVLALQGAFIEHIGILQRLGAQSFPVRLPKELDGLDGLVIPGGESTTISKLMLEFGLMQPVRGLGQEGLPILGTCAGMILLASEVSGSRIETLGLMDVSVKRNAFGRQVDSFETNLNMPALGGEPFRAVFIRAPAVENVRPGVEIVAELPDGVVVAAQQERLLIAAFHPELTDDLRFHRYFLDIVASR